MADRKFPEWETEKNYAPDDCVERGGINFIAARTHFSEDFDIDFNAGRWKFFILPVRPGDIKFASDLPAGYRVANENTPRQRSLMGEFALILAAKGHLVGYEVLEQLADVAIGDA